ncbi:MAG: NFACT RNA binding domain-containing protein [Clostridiales bacterium]|nr:NFACT RNA binding domain-containing protein [Clostridiales bacterium]
MAFDTICIKKTVEELNAALLNGRIDKVHQPEKDELLISVRTMSGAFKLVLSASANNARVHFTDTSKENPKNPPMFCMLLRKHISSGRIVKISQPSMERIIEIDIESYDELGDLTVKHLITEIMGRNSNIILCDDNYRIIDSAKHIDFTVSSVRQILPGGTYSRPPVQDKTPILSDKISDISLDFSHDAEKPEKVIMASVSGISPITARELVFTATGSTSFVCGEFSDAQKDALRQAVIDFASNITYNPCIIYDGNGKPIDFSATAINQYGSSYAVKYYNSMSDVVCEFYSSRDFRERMKQKSADLVHLLHNNIDRCAKKLEIQKKTMRDAENKEKYKIYGDIVTANLYRIAPGQTSLTAENYYEDGAPMTEIELSPRMTPAENAQRYYKIYSKLKNAEVEVAKQIKSTTEDIEYLESTLALAENSVSEADLNAIRAELAEQGYIKKQKKNNKNKSAQPKPMHFVSSDGFDIYVGKNNTQNDYLTLRLANSGDIWFHTKKIHGSHTVIKLGIDKNVPERTMREAAELAAYYSKARESSQVPVDYTQIKNVRKPNGAKPGMVIYDNYNTVYVTPKLPQKEG